MNTSCSSKTTTVIKAGTISINCFADLTDSDTRNPNIYRADLLEEVSQVNGVDGIEGELIISETDNTANSFINDSGELVIELEDQTELDKYSINNQGELIYNG